MPKTYLQKALNPIVLPLTEHGSAEGELALKEEGTCVLAVLLGCPCPGPHPQNGGVGVFNVRVPGARVCDDCVGKKSKQTFGGKRVCGEQSVLMGPGGTLCQVHRGSRK